jgi:signal peptidase I
MSQSAALLLDPGPGLPPVDGTVHGPGCYDGNGELTCGWPERHSKSFLVNLLTTSLMVALAVFAVGIAILVFVAHAHFQTVTSGSMRPTISPGDVAVTEAVPVSSLKAGDVIVFYQPGVTSEPVMHRIVSMVNGVIKTRGDANNVDDPWQVTLSGPKAYRMVAVVPFIGWLIELQRPALIFAGLLVGLVILLELRKEVKGRTTKARSELQA